MEDDKKWEQKFIELEGRYKILEHRFFILFEKTEKEKRYNDELFHELLLSQRDVMDCRSDLNSLKKTNGIPLVEYDG